MLIEHIEYLRKQPAHVRKKYTLIYSVSLTGIIVVIWLSVLFAGQAKDIGPVTTDTNTSDSVGKSIEDGGFFESANTFFDSPSDRQQARDFTNVTEEQVIRQKAVYTGTSTNKVGETSTSSVPVAATSSSTSSPATDSNQDSSFVETILGEDSI